TLFIIGDGSTLLGRIGVRHLGIGARANGVVGRRRDRPSVIEEVGLRHLRVVGSERDVVLLVDERLRLLERIGLGLWLVCHVLSLTRRGSVSGAAEMKAGGARDRRAAVAADKIGEVRRSDVVVHHGSLTVPGDGARAAMALVEV